MTKPQNLYEIINDNLRLNEEYKPMSKLKARNKYDPMKAKWARRVQWIMVDLMNVSATRYLRYKVASYE